MIAAAARDDGLFVKQGEVHGMAQRGGAVQADLRLADRPIHSDLIPRGAADLILSMEPLEGLRYLEYLRARRDARHLDGRGRATCPTTRSSRGARAGAGAAARDRGRRRRDSPRASGLAKACNVVMAGAASTFLPVRPETFEARLRAAFAAKGERVVEANLRAFRAGREAVGCRAT